MVYTVFLKVKVSVAQSCPTLCNPVGYTVHGVPLSMGFLSQEYWSGLPFPPPDRPHSGVEPGYPALQTDSLSSEPPGKPTVFLNMAKYIISDSS